MRSLYQCCGSGTESGSVRIRNFFYALKYHENAFFIVGIVKKVRIRNFLLVKENPDPNPDPKLGRKWDPKKMFRIHNTALYQPSRASLMRPAAAA
jgi:hypothetical protein